MLPGTAADAYIYIAIFFGIAGGIVGKIKGSSFWVWFMISGAVPVLGLLAAIVYRNEREVERQVCPRCRKLCMIHDTVCTRCGQELYFPTQIVPSENELIRIRLEQQRAQR
jgi:uncharacterized paraquat-inducible protein A